MPKRTRLGNVESGDRFPILPFHSRVIDSHSHKSLKSEIDLGFVPPTQTAIEKGWVVEYHPISSIADQETPEIQFKIPANMDSYLDLDDMFLKIELEVKAQGAGNADIDPIKAGTPETCLWAPVNNTLHSLFEKVELKLNNKPVTYNSTYYPWRAYFENLFGQTKWAKNTILELAGWRNDKELEKPSMEAAKKLKSNNYKLELYDRLHLDLCHQQKLLLNGVDVDLKLSPNKPDFYIHVDDDSVQTLTAKFLKAVLYVRHVKVSDSVMAIHESYLTRNPAKYKINRNEFRQFVIYSNITSTSLENVINGQIPKRISLFMINNKAETGEKKTNPFKFDHNDVNHLALYVNEEQHPAIAYTPDFTNKKYAREYFELFRNLRQYPRPIIDLTYEQFMKGFTVFTFNLTPDVVDGSDGHLSVIKRGNVRIDLRFAKATQNTISVLLFCEYDSVIQIDKNRNVTTDFN